MGVLATVLGLFNLFSPNTLGKVAFGWALLVPGSALAYAVWKSWPYPIEQRFSSPDTTIRLVTGDLFDQTTNVVVGMSDCFDIETPHIIAKTSVQGQFLDRIYGNDVPGLRSDLAKALIGKVPEETCVAKPGNTDRYPLGTVATIKGSSRLSRDR